MVRIAGLEPAQVTPLPPQSSASANSAICAQDCRNEAGSGHFRKANLRELRELRLEAGLHLT